MKLMRWSMFFGVVVAASILGCGMPDRPTKGRGASEPQTPGGQAGAVSDPVPLEEELAAKRLHPMVLSGESAESSHPSTGDQEPSELLSDGRTISFQNIIHFPVNDVGQVIPLYLTWKRDALGEEITHAYFSYQKRDVMNDERVEWERNNVSQDKTRQIWFVPLLSLVGKQASELDMAETHEALLELHLASGKIVNLQIAFRAGGPLPRLSHRITSGRAGSFDKISSPNERKTLVQEEFTNPTARRLKLWVKAMSQSIRYHYDIEGHLRATFTQMGSVRIPVAASGSTEWKRSSVPFVIDEMLVNGRSHPLSSDWVEIDLAPYSTVSLEWKGGPMKSQSVCPALVPQYRTEPVRLTFQSCLPRFGCRDVEVNGSREVVDVWGIASRLLEGDLSRQVALSDPSMRPSDLVSGVKTDSRLLNRSIVELKSYIRERWGREIEPSAAWDQCNGLFL